MLAALRLPRLPAALQQARRKPILDSDRQPAKPGSGIRGKAGDQMQMQVARSLAKGDGIHPLAIRELLHKPGSPLHCSTPGRCFLLVALYWAAEMAGCIQLWPPRHRSGVGMVSKQPEAVTADLVALPLGRIDVDLATPCSSTARG